MSLTKDEWIALGEKRINNILAKHRVSYSKHLEIKISEAGPTNQRVEPALLSQALRKMKRNGSIQVIEKSPIEIIAPSDYGKPGDASKLQKLKRIHNMFFDCSSTHQEFCGLHLERMVFDTFLDMRDTFTIIGSGPVYKNEKLVKPPGSEVIFYNGKTSFKESGLDLFVLEKQTQIPIGIECKNIREWIYPASYEVWRMIAKAALLECLPVLAARKISYIARAGFFRHFGILGFETQFQYFHPSVRKHTNYRFQDVVDKDGLGFADIKITTDVPPHFTRFFYKTLLENMDNYYKKFMRNKDILLKYAIDEGMAEDALNTSDRYKLYQEFQSEAGFKDPNFL